MSLSTLRTGLAALVLAHGIRAAPTPSELDLNTIPPPAVNLTAVTDLASYSDFTVYDDCDCNKNNGNEYRNKLNCDVSLPAPSRLAC